MEIAFYQPDISQNVGAAMRLCACLGLSLHVIHPCGFLWSDKRLDRVAMDYMSHVDIHHHVSWEAFLEYTHSVQARVVLLTKYAECVHSSFAFEKKDILLLGRETCGVPDSVAAQVGGAVSIPMRKDCRSLNVVSSLTLVVGEAFHQLDEWSVLKGACDDA